MCISNSELNVMAVKCELTDLGSKSIRASHQLRYLINTRNNGNISQGIASQMKFVCSVKDPTFTESCSKLNIEHKSRMFDLVITNQRIRSNRLRASYYSRKEHFKNLTDNITFCNIEQHLTDQLHKERC